MVFSDGDGCQQKYMWGQCVFLRFSFYICKYIMIHLKYFYKKKNTFQVHISIVLVIEI